MVNPKKDFAEHFEQLRRHWENCVRSQGAYFEGTELSLFSEQCFLYRVSSSINLFFILHGWILSDRPCILYVIYVCNNTIYTNNINLDTVSRGSVKGSDF